MCKWIDFKGRLIYTDSQYLHDEMPQNLKQKKRQSIGKSYLS